MVQPESPERLALEIKRRYAATPEEVWHAWTDPQALSVWFGPGLPNSVTFAETDVRVGGAFRVVFLTPDGKENDVRGTYLEVHAYRKLKFSWAWQWAPYRSSTVTINIEPEGNGSLLSLVHEEFQTRFERDDHETGWTLCIDKLGAFLTTM